MPLFYAIAGSVTGGPEGCQAAARSVTAWDACYHFLVKFTVILLPEEDGGYSVICPAIPGCVSQGESLQEALANIREAIQLCLEARNEEQAPPPVETPEVIAEEIRLCLEDRAEDGLPLTLETREVEIGAEVAV